MPSVLNALFVWVLVSVPVALCIGWLCSPNQLARDADAPIAPVKPRDPSGRIGNRGAALGAVRPDADTTPGAARFIGVCGCV